MNVRRILFRDKRCTVSSEKKIAKYQQMIENDQFFLKRSLFGITSMIFNQMSRRFARNLLPIQLGLLGLRPLNPTNPIAGQSD